VSRKTSKNNGQIVRSVPQPEPLLIDIKGAARLLSVGPWAVRSLLWGRRLKFIRIGKKFLIDPQDIRTFITENKKAA
jgi:hypothetical protein